MPFNATARPLDVMILDYDFLGGTDFARSKKLRLFPIWPDRDRLIHINYSISVAPMSDEGEVPIMPVDDRWVLIHYALYEWWKMNGNQQIAVAEKRRLRSSSRKCVMSSSRRTSSRR